MKSNKLTLPYQKRAERIEFYILPISALLFFVALDNLFITGFFALPFLLLLTIGYLAFRLPMWAVIGWSIVYAVVLLFLLLYQFGETITRPEIMPYLRVTTFLAGGIVAGTLAGHRSRLEESYNALFNIISALPLPVVVSDISGTIVLTNHEAGKLLESPTNDLAGLSFFSTFSDPADQGRSIAKYMNYFDRRRAGPVRLTLHTRGKTKLLLHASLSIVGTASQHYAVTVIEKVIPADLD